MPMLQHCGKSGWQPWRFSALKNMRNDQSNTHYKSISYKESPIYPSNEK